MSEQSSQSKPSQRPTIPLFPLPLVVCPDEQLPLHIFEDRYKDMIAFCRKGDEQGMSLAFGVSLATNNKLYNIGCTVRIEEVATEYDDGRLDVITTGETRYRVHEVFSDKSYKEASVEFFDDDDLAPPEFSLRQKVITLHLKLVELVKGKTDIVNYEPDERASFRIAHSSGLDVLQKQKLLELTSETKRLELLLEHFEKVIPDIERTEEIKRRVLSNGHFKNLRSTDF